MLFCSTDIAVNKLIATNITAVVTFKNKRGKERQRQVIVVTKKAVRYKVRKMVTTKKLIYEVKYSK